MPRISAFYGIVILMYFSDHGPPHFHARYGEFDAQMTIETAEVLHGHLPPRALRLVRTWAGHHRAELMADWDRAQAERPLLPIEPLP